MAAKRHHSSHRRDSMTAQETMAGSSSMIREDHGMPCLLPGSIIQKMYPQGPCGMGSEQQPDLYRGVEMTMAKTASQFRKEKKALNY